MALIDPALARCISLEAERRRLWDEPKTQEIAVRLRLLADELATAYAERRRQITPGRAEPASLRHPCPRCGKPITDRGVARHRCKTGGHYER